jgi:hypothetical protein
MSVYVTRAEEEVAPYAVREKVAVQLPTPPPEAPDGPPPFSPTIGSFRRFRHEIGTGWSELKFEATVPE